MWAKILNWLKKNWIFVLNPLVVIIVYFKIYEKGFSGLELILALTFLANISYSVYKAFVDFKPKL